LKQWLWFGIVAIVALIAHHSITNSMKL